jgi:hypothetical protein
MIISNAAPNVKFSWLQNELYNIAIRLQVLEIFAGEQGNIKMGHPL